MRSRHSEQDGRHSACFQQLLVGSEMDSVGEELLSCVAGLTELVLELDEEGVWRENLAPGASIGGNRSSTLARLGVCILEICFVWAEVFEHLWSHCVPSSFFVWEGIAG